MSKVYREWMGNQGRITPSGFDTESSYAISITGPVRRRRSLTEGVVVGIVSAIILGLVVIAAWPQALEWVLGWLHA